MESGSSCPGVIGIRVTGDGQRLEPGEWIPLVTEEQPRLGAGEGCPSEEQEYDDPTEDGPIWSGDKTF